VLHLKTKDLGTLPEHHTGQRANPFPIQAEPRGPFLATKGHGNASVVLTWSTATDAAGERNLT
jgi:hypothetical protein